MDVKSSAAIHSHPGAAESPRRRAQPLNFWALQDSHRLAEAPAVAEGLLYYRTPLLQNRW